MFKTLNFLDKYLNLDKRLNKNLKNYKFHKYINENPKFMDYDLLISSICYESHHLEKIIKCNYKINLGKQKYYRLRMLIDEFEKRDLKKDKLIIWSTEILDKYLRFLQTKELIVNRIDALDNLDNSETPLENIINRTSIRFWHPKLIDEKSIRVIIEAGINAPISCNRQAYKICIEQNKIENIIFGEAKNSSLFNKAPIKLYVAIDGRLYRENYACALDCGSFCANALLAARTLGIEGCWVYACESLNQIKLKKKFNLPKYYYIYSVLLLGYPAEKSNKPPRKSIENFIVGIGN